MVRFINKLFLLLCSVCIVSCNVNTTHTNELLEKTQAENVTSRFYGALLTKNYDRVTPILSPKFFEGMDENDFKKSLEKTNEKFGDIVTWDLIDWKTVRVTGSSPKCEYLFVYEVEYIKYKAKETFFMERANGNEKIKIVSYKVESEGFLKEL